MNLEERSDEDMFRKIFDVGALLMILALVGCTNPASAPTTTEPAETPAASVIQKAATVPPTEFSGWTMGVGQIPHLVDESYPGCFACHEDEYYMLLPVDHADRTEDTCLSCHAPMD